MASLLVASRPAATQANGDVAPWAHECAGYEKSGHRGLYLAAVKYERLADEEGWSNREMARQVTHAGFKISYQTIRRRRRALAGLIRDVSPSEETLAQFAAQYAGENNALTSSESNEWYTPAAYIESVRAVLGGIDLDPASCEQANETVGAGRFFNSHDNGLMQDWPGRVFLNPPWGDEGPAFGERLIQQYRAGITKAAIGLFNAHATDTDWFQPYFDHPLCFTDHRIDYDSPEEKQTTSTHGSVFAYLGDDWRAFASEFTKWGSVEGKLTP